MFRKNDAQKYRDHGCFLPNGGVYSPPACTPLVSQSSADHAPVPEVLCFCNTEPRIKAIRRVTRKESSPNLGR